MNFVKKHLCNSILFFILPVSIFLSLNKHSRSRADSYKSIIWADAAGYYVYLPFYFIYDSDASKLPDRIVERTGNGFTIDTLLNKVNTKYTSGVAFLQLPFFAVSHVIAKLLDGSPDGFSSIYYYGIMIAAVFYGCFGLWFLCRFLQLNYNPFISFLATLSIFLCTNLYYYIIDASGMSHVYSFFLCASLLYYTADYISKPTVKVLFLLLLLLTMSVLIRPTNILFVLFPLLYNVGSIDDLRLRFQLFFMNRVIFIIAIIISCLVFIPQFIYWYDLSAKPLHYSYGKEGFSNWNRPQFLKIWFSTNNGLFSYSPIILLSLAGVFFMMRKSIVNGKLIAFVFFITSYLFASWHDWTFGCSLGSRPFVEYYPMLAIPMAFVFSSLKQSYQKIPIIAFVAICCYINFDIIYYYDGCFYGSDWDIESYISLIAD